MKLMYLLIIGLSAAAFAACSSTSPPSPVHVVGAMRQVMHEGRLDAQIRLDTLRDRTGLYGIGPTAGLTGELLVNDGRSYVARVGPDSSLVVEESYAVGAPFFVYARVTDWTEVTLPPNVHTIAELEAFVDARTRTAVRPFALKLTGRVQSAAIHVQNLAPGSVVRSPAEAHRGQVDYQLTNEAVEIVGFFSTEHQGVFTHHDTYLHLHLMTADGQKMGHLDAMDFGEMRLFLPYQ